MSQKTLPPSPPSRLRWFLFGGIFFMCLLSMLAAYILTTLYPQESQPVAPAPTQPQATVVIPPTPTLMPEPPTVTPIPPTRTPTDTPTPLPAATLTPTPEPEPLRLTGQGDTILTLTKWSGPALLRVQGNQAAAHFAITTYGADGDILDIPVNTTDPYDGITPLDFGAEQTTRLEVNATGPWTIEILPPSAARTFPLPAEITGQGDEVIVLAGTPDLAAVRGNQAARHFAIAVYDATGDLLDIPVNETEPYEGTVIVPRGGRFLGITATGEWTISVTGAQ